MAEQILHDFYIAYGFSSVVFRYFNVAGAILNNHKKKEHNLIPKAMRSIIQNTPISIYGTDYPTPDGTAIRDYIHVMDIADAHLLALDHLEKHPGAHVYNLCNGRGYSVREVLQTVEKVTGEKLTIIEDKRRAGDPSELIASAEKAQQELGWTPKRPELEIIVEDSWKVCYSTKP